MGGLPTEAFTVSSMLRPVDRPTLEQVLQQPCWWEENHSLDFLEYVSDYLEPLAKVCVLSLA